MEETKLRDGDVDLTKVSSHELDECEEENENYQFESLIQFENPVLADQIRDLIQPTGKVGRPGHVREILNSMLPPREWLAANCERLAQQVSMIPAVRDDVIALQMTLDDRLSERQARDSGVCPVREELYSQCFDELIRQATIECPERGLLLLRVRDEVRMTIAAYTTLYESSITFGMRKTLQAEQGNTELQEQIDKLEAHKKTNERRIYELRNLLDSIEKRESERRLVEDKKRQKEKVTFLSMYMWPCTSPPVPAISESHSTGTLR